MTTATWLDMLLYRWGRYAVKRDSSALGYGSVSPMFRDAASGTGGGTPGSDPGFTPMDIIECNDAIGKLPRDPRRVVIIHYQRASSLRNTAKAADISYSRARELLSFAHGFLTIALDNRKRGNHNP